jgi:hypothetical protein
MHSAMSFAPPAGHYDMHTLRLARPTAQVTYNATLLRLEDLRRVADRRRRYS